MPSPSQPGFKSTTGAFDPLLGDKAIEVLTNEECSHWESVIFSLKDEWAELTFEASSHTLRLWMLGEATYLNGPEAHRLAREKNNKILAKYFTPLYAKIIERLKDILGSDVRLNNDYAMPGFHIYRGEPGLPTGIAYGGSIHFDHPQNDAGFTFSFTDAISFTLTIRLPENGGGLNHWPPAPKGLLKNNWFDKMSDEEKKWIKDNVQYSAYKPGHMIIHDGETLHQIAHNVPVNETDYRITLQGHGVNRGDHWMLFF